MNLCGRAAGRVFGHEAPALRPAAAPAAAPAGHRQQQLLRVCARRALSTCCVCVCVKKAKVS